MGTGVYVKPGSASALDYGFGGGGLSGGRGTSWQPRNVNLRPVNPTRATARVGGRAVTPNSGARNLGGWNNRAPTPRGFTPQPAPKTSATRPFTSGPGTRGGKSSGFDQLLKAAGTARAKPQPARGFGRTAGNTPPRAARPPVPVDTPTPGAKRPFNFRNPLGRTAPGSLPGNPFARTPTPFNPSGADRLPRITYPGQLPRGEAAPGAQTSPGITGLFDVVVRVLAHAGGACSNTVTYNSSPHRVGATQPSDISVRPSGNTTNPAPTACGDSFGYILSAPSGNSLHDNLAGIRSASIFSITPVANQPAAVPPTFAPNRLRPQTPRPLPGADPATAPATAPVRPPFANPGQPAKQPLPYISPDPVPLGPGEAPLPREMQPPARPTPQPLKQPGRQTGKAPLANAAPVRSAFSPANAFSTGVAIGRALGSTARSAINSAEMEDIKQLLKTPVKLQTGQALPVSTPVSGINQSGQPIPNIDLTKPQIPTAPPEYVNNCPPQPGTNCRYDNNNITGKCDAIKKILDDNLGAQYTGDIEFAPCEEEEEAEPTKLESSDKGIPGIDAKLTILGEALNLIWAKVKCETTPLISITESWEIKKELNTGQLVITTKKPDDKSSFRRNFSIPHPRITTQEAAKSIFTYRRRYERGNHLVTLLLKDNSRIRLNVDTESTGQTLMDWLVSECLDLSYLETPLGQYRSTGNAARDIIPCEVEIYSVAYHPTGKKGEMPEWRFIIPK